MHVTGKSENQLHEGRYGEWLALHQVLAGSCMLQLFIYTCLEPLIHYQCCFKFSEVVVTCIHLKERIATLLRSSCS